MQHWLYPANVKFYDVDAALSVDLAFWPQNSKVAIGDQLYIYLAAPLKQIAYLCEITQVDLSEADVIEHVRPFFKGDPAPSKANKKFMQIQVLKRFNLSDNSLLGYGFLKENGLNGMLMGPRKLDNNPQLLEYVSSVCG